MFSFWKVYIYFGSELHEKIWKEAQPQSRIVTKMFDCERGCTSTAPIPALLHVSLESRCIGLKPYQPRYGGDIDNSEVLGNNVQQSAYKYKARAKIYFTFERDAAYFGLVHVRPGIFTKTYVEAIISFSCGRIPESMLVHEMIPPDMPLNSKGIQQVQQLGMSPTCSTKGYPLGSFPRVF